MKNIDKLKKELESIKGEIKKLSTFRDTPSVRKFRRQLEGEKSVILQKISKITQTKETKQKLRSEIIKLANIQRSVKNKRNWNFWKSIQKNYRPDLSLKQIRSMWKKHKKGLETDISDVAWQNPSP